MELWQTTRYGNNIIKRYRCVCGQEESEIIGTDKPKELPKEPPKKVQE
jgi:hypothetical protein